MQNNKWYREFGFRFIKLAETLEKIRFEQFHFGRWVGLNWSDDQEENMCGTSACSLGWASLLPEFKKINFKFKSNSKFYLDDEQTSVGDYGTRNILAERLGINVQEFSHLFYPDSCAWVNNILLQGLSSRADPFEAGAHIRKFVYHKIKTSMPDTLPEMPAVKP